MAKKKTEEEKTKTPQKKTIKQKKDTVIEVNKLSISQLFEKNNIKPLNAVGFLDYYGLTEDFKREFERKEVVKEFSDGEFKDMYERYIKRGI